MLGGHYYFGGDKQADSSDKEALIALLIALAKAFQLDGRFKAGDGWERLKANDAVLQDAIYTFESKTVLRTGQILGTLLKRYVDRNVEGLVLKCKYVSGSWSYWIELTNDTHRHSIIDTRGSDYSSKPRTLSSIRPIPIKVSPLSLGG